MANWETIFNKEGKFFHKPHEDMVSLINLFKKHNVKRVLDLGCGSGRHTIMLAKAGFEVHALDNAPSGLKQTKKWLNERGLKAKLKKASCYERFPFKDNFFDALISTQVIHYARIKEIQYCISEMRRVLKSKGLIFVTVAKTKRNKFRSKVKMIAPRTFVPLNGHEVGVPHYQFNKELIRKNFSDFNILDLYVDKSSHYCLVGRLKRSD